MNSSARREMAHCADPEFSVDVPLTLLRSSRLAQPVDRAAFQWQMDGCVAVCGEYVTEGIPAARVVLAFQGVQNEPEYLVGQYGDEHVGVDTVLDLMERGSEAEIGLDGLEAVFSTAERHVEPPQLFSAQITSVGAQRIASGHIILVIPALVVTFPGELAAAGMACVPESGTYVPRPVGNLVSRNE